MSLPIIVGLMVLMPLAVLTVIVAVTSRRYRLHAKPSPKPRPIIESFNGTYQKNK